MSLLDYKIVTFQFLSPDIDKKHISNSCLAYNSRGIQPGTRNYSTWVIHSVKI